MDGERRKFIRRSCVGSAELRLSVEERPLHARIVNVSIEGCLIELPSPAPAVLESTTELRFTVNQLPFLVRGVVKSLRSDRSFGFYFPALSQRVRLQLTDLIQELGEDLNYRLQSAKPLLEA